MMTYEFTLVLIGIGTDEDEAWIDAIDSFGQDPGEPFNSMLLKDDKEEE